MVTATWRASWTAAFRAAGWHVVESAGYAWRMAALGGHSYRAEYDPVRGVWRVVVGQVAESVGGVDVADIASAVAAAQLADIARSA